MEVDHKGPWPHSRFPRPFSGSICEFHINFWLVSEEYPLEIPQWPPPPSGPVFDIHPTKLMSIHDSCSSTRRCVDTYSRTREEQLQYCLPVFVSGRFITLFLALGLIFRSWFIMFFSFPKTIPNVLFFFGLTSEKYLRMKAKCYLFDFKIVFWGGV